MNSNEGFVQQVVAALMPVDLAAAAQNGNWLSLKSGQTVQIFIIKSAGAAGEIPTFTFKQAQAIAGTGSKALNFPVYYNKSGAAGSGANWTKVTRAATNTIAPAAGNTGEIYRIDLDPNTLDVNGGFDCFRIEINDVGSTIQNCAAIAVYNNPRYASESQMIGPAAD